MTYFYCLSVVNNQDSCYTLNAYFENLNALKKRGPKWLIENTNAIMTIDIPHLSEQEKEEYKKGYDFLKRLVIRALNELAIYDGIEKKHFEDNQDDEYIITFYRCKFE